MHQYSISSFCFQETHSALAVQLEAGGDSSGFVGQMVANIVIIFLTIGLVLWSDSLDLSQIDLCSVLFSMHLRAILVWHFRRISDGLSSEKLGTGQARALKSLAWAGPRLEPFHEC